MAKPGTKAYLAEYLRLTRHIEVQSRPDTISSLIAEYRASDWFRSLRFSTKRSYERALDLIGNRFGTMPLPAVEARGSRKIILEWLDEFSATPRTADLIGSVFSRLLSFGVDREAILRHPLTRVERKAKGSRKDIIWPVETIKLYITQGRPHLVSVVVLALWTMQREGDCLSMPTIGYDGERIRVKQAKTGAYIWVRPADALLPILAEAKAMKRPRVLANSFGDPWTGSGFRASFRKDLKRVGISGLTFHDLRGSAITFAYAMGCTVEQIAEISGHSKDEAEGIIRRFYLAGDEVVRAIQKAIA